MDQDSKEHIRRSRKLLKNPYAHLNGEGAYDAVLLADAADIREARRLLQDQYAYLDDDGGFSAYVNSPRHRKAALISIDKLFEGVERKGPVSRRQIEVVARNLQREMWAQRSVFWPERDEISPTDVLDPLVALGSIGYSVELEESLGQEIVGSKLVDVAGVLDRANHRVRISKQFDPEIRNFTTAHELGHAILHRGTSELHRDRALSGAPGPKGQEREERQADIFATCFLLPEKQVRATFERLFLTQRFVLTEESAFALTGGSLGSARDKCRSKEDLARMLAGAEYYDNVHFYSMAKQFTVSITAMSFRLEELNLIGCEP